MREFEDQVVATSTMPTADWKAAYLFAWVLQTCHVLRLTQVPAIYAQTVEGFSYAAFYQAVIDFAGDHPESVLGRELRLTRELVDRALEGGGFDVVMPEFSDIYWPPEEASFLRICLELPRFFAEFRGFLEGLARRERWKADAALLRDLLRYQEAIVVKLDHDGSEELEVGAAVHTFYRAVLEGRAAPLTRGHYRIRIEDDLRLPRRPRALLARDPVLRAARRQDELQARVRGLRRAGARRGPPLRVNTPQPLAPSWGESRGASAEPSRPPSFEASPASTALSGAASVACASASEAASRLESKEPSKTMGGPAS